MYSHAWSHSIQLWFYEYTVLFKSEVSILE